MNILEDLRTDHHSFARTLARLAAIANDIGRSSCGAQWTKILSQEACDALERLSAQMRSHQDQERRFLFRAIRQRAPASAPLLDAMLREHSHLEQLLAQARSFALSSTRRSSHRFASALKAFDDCLRAHLKREESEIFSLAQTGFTQDELADLTRDDESAEFPEFVDQGAGD